MKSISGHLTMLIATLGVAVPGAHAGVAPQTSTVAVQTTVQTTAPSPAGQLLARRGADDAPGDDRGGGGGGDNTGCDDHGTDVCRTAT